MRAAAGARRRRALRRHNFTGTKDNIVHLLDNPHFELIRHDVIFPLYVEVDEIYNLACPAARSSATACAAAGLSSPANA